ncbi:hypothetical protein BJ138DRAFT_302640 [Hygrophoropsis aurantiaca]|uniref:Uncharacterized protein n=1 Tax=Hygrophoropsis aurantiaca TaxID=72124 RepID=A0ACB8A895_9AGAM|nr:hypothetical protein BJ138DRAFT_302640 [Hygrophoropsis aurantiaca]
MQVDNHNPVQFSFDSYTSAFDDFFNLEPAQSSSSGSSSSSPRSPLSYTAAPLTPPSLNMPPPVTASDDSFFNLFLQDEYAKVDPAPPSTIPFDFLSAFGASSSPESSSTVPSPQSQPMFAIDPQLVGTPATSKAMSDFDEEEEEHDLVEHEDDDDLDREPEISAASKVGGRGRAASRKGTVQSGGIKKQSTDKENSKRAESQPLKILEPEDWRPSPEEYKKMSSKEKRQLRNKISARNFRVRRKEYITTLEGDIAERDRLIDTIRTELGSSKSENVALREEINALKKCLLEGRGLDLPLPAPLPAVSAAAALSSAAATTATPARQASPTYNPHKDLPTSPRLGARTFWGGLGAGGITPVHTTLVPPIAVSSAVLAGKTPVIANSSVSSILQGTPSVLQENINPGLNPISSKTAMEKKGTLGVPGFNPLSTPGGFDSFTEMNPFTLKTLDAYRMQLWGKMAAQQQQHHHHAQQAQQNFGQQAQFASGGIIGGLRPHYIASKASGLSGKASTSTSALPPASTVPSKEQAYAAALASQTLLGKLGSAFWEAFSGSSSSPSLGHGQAKGQQWDAEKVRKVLEGKAVVRVVDVEPAVDVKPIIPLTAVKSSAGSVLGSSADVKPVVGSGSKSTSSCGNTCATILEESMRSLTLAKK